MAIIFNQQSIFHLYRLGTLVYGKTGKRYTLSIEKERLDLIRFCNHHSDKSIQRQFSAFVDALDHQTHTQLLARNLITAHSTSNSGAQLAG